MSARCPPPPRPLPAVRIDGRGRRHVDLRAVAVLAWPLFLNSVVNAALNLTDTWFLGRLSASATAAVAALYWISVVAVLVLGGAGLAVQTLVAQEFGRGRRRRAAQAAWMGLWAAIITLPGFALLAFSGPAILTPFALDPEVEALALEYWGPRMLGGPAAVALWALAGFFNGIGRPVVSLAVTVGIVLLNMGLNELLIFRLGMGVAGAAWATSASLTAGVAAAAALFLARPLRQAFRTHLVARPSARPMRRLVALGIPMGLFAGMDLGAFALFQLMQVSLGPAAGAATQITMMLTSISYWPAIGLALAGTTLVGQSVGAGDREWAMRVGNAVILLTLGWMGAVTLLLALAAPWLVPFFITPADPRAPEVIRLAVVLLWIACGYQVFDALNLGAGFCLRGAADVRVPTVMLLVLSWGLFLPLAHALTFGPGQGWVDFLPQWGLGAPGGWLAALAYTAVLGPALLLRWRSGAWKRIRA